MILRQRQRKKTQILRSYDWPKAKKTHYLNEKAKKTHYLIISTILRPRTRTMKTHMGFDPRLVFFLLALLLTIS